MRHQHRFVWAFTAALTLGFIGRVHGQDAPAAAPALPDSKPATSPAPAPEKPESLEINPDRLKRGRRALSDSQGLLANERKVLARTSADGPDRLVTTDFEGRIVMFTPDGVSFRRIKLEGVSGRSVVYEDLKCAMVNGTPHWLAVTNGLRSQRVTVGLYTMDGKRVASHVVPTKPGEFVRVKVEFGDVTGDKKPEIVGNISRSSNVMAVENADDAEDALRGYSSYLFVLSDKCEMLATKRLDIRFPGVLHICTPEREGESPVILLQGDSRIDRFMFQQLDAPAVPSGPAAGEPAPPGAAPETPPRADEKPAP
jgi:hypothetical protein